MNELPRVPLLRKMRWIGDEDVCVTVAPPFARRISMDINETVLAQLGARVVEHAMEELGRTVPHLYADQIQRMVDALLLDKEWAKPIIEEELRRAVRAFVADVFRESRGI